jgi:hypothetical protein
MSRTYRRRGQEHEYRWVLRDWNGSVPFGSSVLLDPRSREARRAIARFHSDAETTMGGAAPRWYRKVFDRRLRTSNDKQLRRWFANPGYDPLTQASHRHSANWSWW